MADFDKTKEYCTIFTKEKNYFGQDGKGFDMQTLEEVMVAQPPATITTPKSLAPLDILKCKFCGKTYRLGKTDKTKKSAISRMERHLKKEHSESINNGDYKQELGDKDE